MTVSVGRRFFYSGSFVPFFLVFNLNFFPLRKTKRKEVKKEMLQNPQKKLEKIRKELMECLRETFPTKEFSATIMMAMVRLHMIEAGIRETQNLEERRRLIDEFNNKRKAIERGIRLLWQSSGRHVKDSEERIRRAMS